MESLNNEQERGAEGCVTTDFIVLSITSIDRKLEDTTGASGTDKRSMAGSIVQSIASIHQLFEDVTNTCNSNQRVHSDVADLAHKIRIQQVAFDNGCKMLLVTAAKSRQDVDNMIEDPSHPIWKDKVAHRNLNTVMARFYHACLAALKHLQECLSELKVGLRPLRRKGKKMPRRLYQLWFNITTSQSFATTEDFPKIVQKMRDYNDVFCTFVWQAVPHRSAQQVPSSLGEDLGRPYAIGAAQGELRHFRCIQRTSQVLYDALSDIWTCGDHEAHSLSISLQFDYTEAGALTRGEEIRFNVAVTSPCFDSPYHLIVDTAHSGSCIYQAVEEDRSSKKTYLVNGVAGLAARPKSSGLSELHTRTDAQRAGGQRATCFVRPKSLHNRVPNLGLKEDLCYWLRQSSVTIKPKQGTECSCLGFFETGSGITFSVAYVLRDEYQNQGSYSLDDVLLRANSESRALSLDDRLRTALFLAAGVLHLGSSSWLRQAWSSKDIHFFDMDDYERCSLGKPFLRVQLDKNTARGSGYATQNYTPTRLSLLSLGFVLIELAFSAPWRKLQLEETITKDLLEWENNLLNLMRLSNTVSRELGSRYAKIVKTCLSHGLGSQDTQGLSKAELDEVVFENVVGELDQCLSAVTFKSGVCSSPSETSCANDPALRLEPSAG